MKQHKWHKEIKAWADGAEIEFKVGGEGEWMLLKGSPYWECESDLFRIKPQPKQPKYLYVINNWGSLRLSQDKELCLNEFYVGKIEVHGD